MTGFPAKVRALITERDEGCVICGNPGTNIHHRHPRGMGGSKAAWINRPSNGILLCGSGTTGCHGHVETNRAWAVQHGYLVRHGVQLPVNIPVAHVRHGLVFLTDDGRVVPVTPPPF